MKVDSNALKKFKCTICGISFLFENTLEKHLQRHDQDAIAGLSIDNKKSDLLNVLGKARLSNAILPKRYICKCCSAQFLDKNSLASHEQLHENSDGTFGCLKCKKYFITPKEVVEHTIEHRNDKEDFK